MIGEFSAVSPEETFAFGERVGAELRGGEVVLLYGGLGAGKTLLAKGMLNALEFDIDEVTSPSFTLVNLYRTPRFDVHHIDLWRLEGSPDPAAAVGFEEILEDETAVTIIEWAEHLRDTKFRNTTIRVHLFGDGDEPRQITIDKD